MTTKPSNAAAYAFAAFGIIASPVLALYLDLHTRIPLAVSIVVLYVLVFFIWRKMLRRDRPSKNPSHPPIALPETLSVGNGPHRIYCDQDGIRLGPDTLTSAAPFTFKEDVLLFQKNRYEMFIAWSEVSMLMSLSSTHGSLQIVYRENPYKAWVSFQPPAISPEEHTLLQAFIRQRGKNPVN